jgi:hypothetical protein
MRVRLHTVFSRSSNATRVGGNYLGPKSYILEVSHTFSSRSGVGIVAFGLVPFLNRLIKRLFLLLVIRVSIVIVDTVLIVLVEQVFVIKV